MQQKPYCREECFLANEKKLLQALPEEGEEYYLIGNHCLICAAATECQGFCRSELHNFKQLIGAEYGMCRVEYIIENGNRCVYKIEKAN